MANSTTHPYTWTRLKSGGWAVLVDASCEAGDEASVAKKDGSLQDVTLKGVSKPFAARFGAMAGRQVRYGYPEQKNGGGNGYRGRNGGGRRRYQPRECPVCGEEKESGASSCWECGYRW